MRIVELREEGHFSLTRRALPDNEAERLIASGQGRGITPIRFLYSQTPYNRGEIAGFYDAEAQRYLDAGLAEPVEVEVPPARESSTEEQI